VPAVVVELAVDGLHQRLEGAGAQVDDEPDGAALEREVDVVGRLARVQQQPVALPRAERQRQLVRAALDRAVREVVAEELVALEGGHVLLPACRGRASAGGAGGLHLGCCKGDLARGPRTRDLTWGPHLGTSLGDLTWGPCTRDPTWGPRTGTSLGDLAWGPCTGDLTWGPHMGTSLGDLAPGTSLGDLTWGPHLGT